MSENDPQVLRVGDESVTIHPIFKNDPTSVQSNAMEVEDAFVGMYQTSDNPKGTVIAPPYDLDRLFQFVQENNTLGQCITAMEVNIDGTGYEIERRDEEALDDAEEAQVQPLKDFFDEPWPGMSMTTLRRKIRRDLESCGNGYLEILPNPAGEIIFARPLDAQTMRMVRLGEAIPVKKKMQRNGKSVEVTVMSRERAFVQKVGSRTVFFKEYGATRDIDKVTGDWGPQGSKLPSEKRGTEIIHFTVQKDAKTPYGVPRWINQLPSVIGSRRAEEVNLDYFDAGGIPPVIVFIKGGQASVDSMQHLRSLLSGGSKNNMKAAVVEIHSTSGDLNSAGSVQTTVERFGNEQSKDSMFEGYDTKCEARIRGSFRLPPLFVGKAESHNFATAYVSYMVAEAQVFQPEREEFDEILNVTLLRGLQGGDDTYWYRSKKLPITNTEFQMRALEHAKGMIDNEDFVDALNEITGTDLRYDAEEMAGKKRSLNEQESPTPPPQPQLEVPGMESVQQGLGDVAKSDDPLYVLGLVEKWTAALTEEDQHQLENVSATVSALRKEERSLFNAMLASKTMTNVDLDLVGSAELCGCASELCGGAGFHDH